MGLMSNLARTKNSSMGRILIMGLINWLKKILCSDVEKRAEKLEEAAIYLAKELQKCKKKYKELEKKYEEDCAYYEARIKTLTEQLLRRINLPDLKPLIKNGTTEVYPRQFLYRYAYNWETADLTYLSLEMDDWKRVLTEVRRTIKAVWTENVFDCPVPEDVAFGLGVFFADGTCGLRGDTYSGAYWRIVNTNKKLLERVREAFQRQWKDLKFEIVKYPSEDAGKKTNLGVRNKPLYSLVVKTKTRRRDGVRGDFIKRFFNDFYMFDGLKKLPACVWETTRIAKLRFLEGVLAGDGERVTKNYWILYTKSRWASVGLAKIMEDVGWRFTHRIYRKRNRSYHVFLINRSYEAIPFIVDYVKKHREVEMREVIEFVSKMFNKGENSAIYLINKAEEMGYIKRKYPRTCSNKRQILVFRKDYPNGCDDFALLMAAMVAYSSYKSGFNKQLAFGIAWSMVHAYNVFITKDDKVWVYEPQTNVIIGEANEIKKGKSNDYIYFTREIWFMG